MSCTNCYNGCSEIVSDQCVKYTGNDVPELGITNGDTLATVEQAIVNFLVPAINGTGITPIINPAVICDAIKQFLPTCTTCTGFSLNQILTAIIQSVCSIQNQVNTINNTLDVLNSDYTLPADCLTGVTPSSGTHDILQAVIIKLCALNAEVINIINNLLPLYVLQSDLNNLIQDYLNQTQVFDVASAKMIPYSAIPYFGPISNYPNTGDSFDISGAGQNYWDKVYLCNGSNGTPDLRGRVLAGVTTGMGGAAYPAGSAVNPATPGNPNYTVNGLGIPITEYGTNIVTLGIGQIPSHAHANTAIAVAEPHYHFIANLDTVTTATTLSSTNYIAKKSTFSGDDYNLAGTGTVATIGKTSNVTETITVTMSNADNGGNGSHNNVQPSRACYYIMYIP